MPNVRNSNLNVDIGIGVLVDMEAHIRGLCTPCSMSVKLKMFTHVSLMYVYKMIAPTIVQKNIVAGQQKKRAKNSEYYPNRDRAVRPSCALS